MKKKEISTYHRHYQVIWKHLIGFCACDTTFLYLFFFSLFCLVSSQWDYDTKNASEANI